MSSTPDECVFVFEVAGEAFAIRGSGGRSGAALLAGFNRLLRGMHTLDPKRDPEGPTTIRPATEQEAEEYEAAAGASVMNDMRVNKFNREHGTLVLKDGKYVPTGDEVEANPVLFFSRIDV